MVRLNRNKLSKKQLDKLFWQFASTVSPSDPKHANRVLIELLGEEERIMLAKRLAVAVLLIEGYSMYKISRLLKLSPSTVEHTSEKLKKGGYDYSLGVLSKSKKDYFSFLNTLDNILHLGGILPHYNGLDRYRYFR